MCYTYNLFRKGAAVFMAVALSACAGPSGQQANSDKGGAAVQETAQQAEFPFPEIPAMMTQPEERLAYLLQHYWEKFDFSDTTLVNSRDIAEQGLVNHFSLLTGEMASERLVKESVEAFCRQMESEEHARKVFLQRINDYLYNPNSPYYNEKLYGVYLDCMLQSKVWDEARKSTFRFKRELIRRNNPGMKATSFTYYLPDGRKRNLQQTPVKGDRMLLVFYDPECPNCHGVLEQLKRDAILAQAVAKKKITVLAIYTEGDDSVWKKTLPDMPKEWIVGNDRQQVKDKALYDLKAMPSLYLLDGQKTVLLKDASYDEIRTFF